MINTLINTHKDKYHSLAASPGQNILSSVRIKNGCCSVYVEGGVTVCHAKLNADKGC